MACSERPAITSGSSGGRSTPNAKVSFWSGSKPGRVVHVDATVLEEVFGDEITVL